MHAVARLDEASPADGYADRVHNGGEYETTRPRTRDLELLELIAAFRKGSPADRTELNAALMDARDTLVTLSLLHHSARWESLA